MANQAQRGRGGPSTRVLLVAALALLALLLCGIVSGWLLRCRGPVAPTPTPTATRAWPGVAETMTSAPPSPTATPTPTSTPTPAAGEPATSVPGTPRPSPTTAETPGATPPTATPSPTTPAAATATATTAGPGPTPTHTKAPPIPGLYIELEGEPLQAANAAPGVAIPPQELTLRNRAISTVTAKYRLRASFGGGSSAFFEGLNVRACRRASDGSWPCYYEGTLRDMLLTPDAGQPGTTPDMLVSPGQAQRWRFTYTPDSSLGNWAQGATCTFSIVVEATEASNPGWLP